VDHEDTYIKYYEEEEEEEEEKKKKKKKEEEEIKTLICSKLDTRWKKDTSVTKKPELTLYSLLSKSKNPSGRNGKQKYPCYPSERNSVVQGVRIA
jgi:hypothetical protein